MKKYIFVILAVLIFALTTAQANTPKEISGYEITEMRVIYRIGAVMGEGSCAVTNYWWVDEWGRPVNESGWKPETVFSKEDILKKYLDTIPEVVIPKEQRAPNSKAL